MARQFARERKGHRGHAALGRRVGGLADLPVERGHRCRADHNAALAARVGRALGHRSGREADHVEGAGEVHPQDVHERLEIMHAVASEHARGHRDAGAVDEAAQAAEALRGEFDRAGGSRLRCHVGLAKGGVGAERRGQGFTVFAVAIHEQHARAGTREHQRGGRAEPRCGAGDDERCAVDLHAVTA